MAMNTQDFLDFASADALGLLDSHENAQFRAELAHAAPDLVAAYRQAVNAASNLSLAAPDAPLSPKVLDTLMARVEGRVAPASPKPKTRIAWIMPFRIASAVAVGLAIVTMGLVTYISSLQEKMGQITSVVADSRTRIQALEDTLAQKNAMLEVLKSSQMQMVVMNGQEVGPTGYGKIIWDPVHKKAILHVSNLPAQPDDKDYQLWVIRDKVPVDAGVFKVRGNRQNEGGELYKIDDLAEADRAHINAFAITLEPKGGLKKPSGKIYLLGSI